MPESAGSRERSPKADPKPALFLIDGSALVYRSHFAFVRNPLLTSKGKNVSAVFGFAQTLFTLIGPEKARFAAIAMDGRGKTVRHHRYEAYKANRPSLPDDLAEQLPIVRELIDTLRIPIVERGGIEADDLIASLALAVHAGGHEVRIVSADKDFHQLLRPGLLQWVPPRGAGDFVLLGPAEVRERWGVDPPRVLDVLALVGDSVDNVPGVPGVGEKTAIELIRQFGDLDTLYARLEEVPRPALREKLRAHRESAFLSRDLIRLDVSLPVEADLSLYELPDLASCEGLLELLQRLEFRKMIETLGLKPARAWTARYETVGSAEKLAELVAGIGLDARCLAIEAAVAGGDPRRDPLAGIGFGWREGEAYYVPVSQACDTNVPLEEVRRLLGPLLADPAVEKVGEALKSDLHALAAAGIEVKGKLFDVDLAAYLLDPDRTPDLSTLSLERLGHRRMQLKELLGSGRLAVLFDRLPVDRARDFAAEEADLALRLRSDLLRSLEDRGQAELLEKVEEPLLRVLYEMEEAGVHVDAAQLAVLSKELAEDLARQEAEVFRLAGTEFNINSPQQLGEILFQRLKLARGRRTKTGYSTDQQVLEDLAAEQPIARAVLEYRQTMKLRSTYVETLPKLIDPVTGRIHARFHQTVAATGRLSSSDPNLQNIPIRSAQGRKIRRAFVPQTAGDVLLSADYSQIELRVLAHLSGDPALIAAFREGQDIHRATAARIFDVPPESVDPILRARAKIVNFGVLYGMGPQRLSREMGIPLAEARTFIEQYFAKMPGVRGYLQESLERARREGYVTTILGRRRYLPSLRSTDSGGTSKIRAAVAR
ncbi:MAG: DNA polymerase I [Candidatus Eisenbacteria bacterium]|nr:DNA polymerase I [Candidatus Eisenbacteria bacterium]